MKEYIISGQKVTLTDGGNFRLKINSLFRSAGVMYNFPRRCSGIGINEDIVNVAEIENRNLIIELADSPNQYIISPTKVKEIAKNFNSVYKSEKNPLVKLYVIPLSELSPAGKRPEAQKTQTTKAEAREDLLEQRKCLNCSSQNLDLTQKHYVICQNCGKIFTRKLYLKR